MHMTGTNRELLTIDQLAEKIGVHTRTVRRWRKAGMPHISFSSQEVRYDLEEVIAWAKAKKGSK